MNSYSHLKHSTLPLFMVGLIAWLMPNMLEGQSVYFKEAHPVNHIFKRLDLLYPDSVHFHTGVKPFPVLAVLKETAKLSSIRNPDIKWLALERIPDPDTTANHKLLFGNPGHMWSYSSDDFAISINPILYLSAGLDAANDDFLFRNTRGLEITANVDSRFYIYSAYYENQADFPYYIKRYTERYSALRGQGNYKDYMGKLLGQELNGFDFSNAQAYLGYHMSKHTYAELGHSRHFIGHGIRSMLLDNSGQNYFYLKFGLDIWKLKYQSIFAELTSISARFNTGNELLPKKYMASHYLSILPGKNWEIGLFETVVFSREDHFEFQYLNPVILYRSVEHLLDSPDNVLVGVNIKWIPVRKLSLYGQWILDEFNTSEFFAGTGWWGNKYAFQLGINYINALGINRLDMQLEYNLARPYTYSHWKKSEAYPALALSSYSHYNQALAHPLGANFRELIYHVKYRFGACVKLDATWLYSIWGEHPEENVGHDILLSNESRTGNYDIGLLEGVHRQVHQLRVNISWELSHQLYVDLGGTYRHDSPAMGDVESLKYIHTGLRYNFWTRTMDY